jgi:hypothetical protein
MASISLKYKSKSGNLTAPGDVDPGAMIPLATVLVGSGGSSYVEFTGISNNYEHLQIRGITNASAGGGSVITMRVGNGSVDSGTNYSWHQIYGYGTAVDVSGNANTSNVGLIISESSVTTSFSGFISDILDYSNTSKYKTIRTLTGIDTNNTSGVIALRSGSWRSTSVIDTIRIIPPSGVLIQNSHFALYGIKRAGA